MSRVPIRRTNSFSRAIALRDSKTALSGRADFWQLRGVKTAPRPVRQALADPVKKCVTDVAIKERLFLFAERPVNLCPEQGEQRIAVAFGDERAD